VIAADATARRRLAMVRNNQPDQVPGIIAYLSARRWDATTGPASARMRVPDGRWFVLDASLMDDVAGNVAVVMPPAAPSYVLSHVLRSYGLTAREREVAALLAQGHSAKSIASTPITSSWTVQDHVKAAYRTTGIGARSDLASLATGAGSI
jgi:DNA-binding CsgD family transcriptional regulator